MGARAGIWRWNARTIRTEARQLIMIAALVGLAVGAGVAAVVGAYNLSPPPGADFGRGNVRATVIGDSAAQQAAFEEAFGAVGVIADASVAVPGSFSAVNVRVQAPDDVVAAPLLSLVSGDWPATGQVALTDGLARSAGVEVGDRYRVGPETRPVVAIVENPTDLDDEFALVADLDGTGIEPDAVVTSFLLDQSVADIGDHAVGPLGTEDAGEGLPEVRTMAAIATSIVVAVALIQVGLLASAAFAVVNARRRRQYGLLAAVGAAPQRLAEAAILLGAVTGAIGALIGTTVGLLLVWILVPDLEAEVGHRIDLAIPWWTVVPAVAGGVAAAAVASWWPSRPTTRGSVLGALGASPPATGPWWKVMAIAGPLAVGGSAMLVWAIRAESIPASVAGVVVALVGVLLLAPLVVSAVAVVAGRLPLPARIAGRRLARQRSRSAAVVAAVSVALGLALTAVFASASLDDRGDRRPRNLPEELAVVWIDRPIDGPAAVPTGDRPGDREIEGLVAAAAAQHSATWEVVPIEVPVVPEAEPTAIEMLRRGVTEAVVPEVLLQRADASGDDVIGFGERDDDGEPIVYVGRSLWVATPSLRAALGLGPGPGDDQSVVSRAEEVVLSGQRTLPSSARTAVAVDSTLPRSTSLADGYVSPALVEAQGWRVETLGWLVVSDDAIGPEARLALEQALAGTALAEFQDRPGSTGSLRSVSTALAVLIGVVILAVTTGLYRIESAPESGLLASVGASPRVLRAVEGATAGWLALAGGVLGLSLGTLTLLGLSVAPGADLRPVLPWLQLGVVVILFPLLSAGLAASRRPAPVRP